ncbi:MAG TPA: arginase family protein [Solirubrobacterales bacterium]|nr:arginase family protein [Solirubrobacterales bacterium]
MGPFTYIGVPIDSVRRRGGAEHAPATLRELGLPAALGSEDRGDLDVRIRGEERDPETGLLASADVLRVTATIRTAVAGLVGDGARPFLAGGCCAELPGALAGARDALGPIALIHLDGHLDLYDGETSLTGEAADMPISVALGLGPAAWVEIAGGPSVEPQRLALIGFNDRTESIEHGMRQPETLDPPPTLRPAADLHEAPAPAAAAVLERLAPTPLWLHFDVDVLDQKVFPATDYPMPGGLDWNELTAALRPLLNSPHLIGTSLACYAPDKDPDLACGRALVQALSETLNQAK